MTAQPEHPAPDRRVRPIPHTINAIGEALPGEKRARFHGEVLYLSGSSDDKPLGAAGAAQ